MPPDETIGGRGNPAARTPASIVWFEIPADNPERANGIKFVEYSGRALAKSMRKGVALYETPQLLQRFRRNGMAADFSWDRTAVEYLKVYQQVVA